MWSEIDMMNEVCEAINEEGRVFLADRLLSIPEAEKSGIRVQGGEITFSYVRDGKIVRTKSRSLADKKKQRMDKVGDPDNFKMPFFRQFPAPTKDYLIITEGEFDCVALSQLGACNCVSLPNGSGSVETSFRNNYEYLQQFDIIYIAFDMDEPGEKAAKVALSKLTPAKYRRINFPVPCKDANEWLMKNPDLEFKDLQKLMDEATKVTSPLLTPMLDFLPHITQAIDIGVSTGFNGLDNIIGGIRLGEVTVISADTGAGKSTFCVNLIKNLAEQGGGVSIHSYEMNPIMTSRKLASAVLRKGMKYQEFSPTDISQFSNWLKEKNCYLNTSNEDVNMEMLRKTFELASLAYGVQYILLDHLDYIHSGGKKATALENIDDAVRGIHKLAMEFKVGVILVVHPKQIESLREITMNDLKGSSAIKQYADNIIILTRMDRLNANDVNRVLVHVWKNRLAGKEGSFSLRYIPQIDGYAEELES